MKIHKNGHPQMIIHTGSKDPIPQEDLPLHQSASHLKTPTGRNQTSSPLRRRQGQFGSQWLRGGMALKIHETYNSLAPKKNGGGAGESYRQFCNYIYYRL